jgi:hypothetical protein
VDKPDDIPVPAGYREQIIGVLGTLLAGYREQRFGLSGTEGVRIALIFKLDPSFLNPLTLLT